MMPLTLSSRLKPPGHGDASGLDVNTMAILRQLFQVSGWMGGGLITYMRQLVQVGVGHATAGQA